MDGINLDSTQWSQIDSILKEVFKEYKPPGLAIGFFNGEGLIREWYKGYAKVKEKELVDGETCFMIGSITKLFTLIAVMQQWEKKRFQLDDKVNNFLPKGKIVTKKGWPAVTFQHLLTHTSGIGELRRFRDIFKKGFRLLTYDDQDIPPLSSLHDLPVYPASPAGLKYAYSNIGVSLLGYIVENLSGMGFREYVLKNILDPLQMHNSDLIRSEKIVPNEAFGYKSKNGKYIRTRRWNNIIKPSGALVSTVKDMANFGQMLINRGIFKGHKILEPETFDVIWTPRYYAHELLKDRHSIGLIYRIHKINGIRMVEHTGGVSGFNAQFCLFPDHNLGFYSFCNLNEGLHNRSTLSLRNRVVKTLTNLKEEFIPPKEPNTKYWGKIEGYYKAYPGFLTNTRLITEGIEFKIKQKGAKLIYSGLIGDQKGGDLLYPTENPLVFEIHHNEKEGIFYKSKYIFTLGDSEKIIDLSRELEKLRKVKFSQTLRFKGLLVIIILIAITLFSILINLSFI
mgnify:CR=1 FL=1